MLYKLEALDTELRVVAETQVSFASLGGVVVFRLPNGIPHGAAAMIFDDLKRTMGDTPVLILPHEVEILRIEVIDEQITDAGVPEQNSSGT